MINLSSKEGKVCPGCGLPYSYIKEKRVGNKIYVYAVHYLGYEKVGGKVRKKTKECYLGPKEQYDYVTQTHEREGLVLRGLIDSNRALEYLDALIRYISGAELDRTLAFKLATRFEELAKRLREYAGRHKE